MRPSLPPMRKQMAPMMKQAAQLTAKQQRQPMMKQAQLDQLNLLLKTPPQQQQPRVLRACAKAIGQESRGPVRRQLEISGSTRWRSINNLLKFNKHYNRVDNPHHHHHGIQSHSGRDS